MKLEPNMYVRTKDGIILNNEENISWINPSDIKSIVTKEQFSSMEYRLGGDK